MMRLAAMLLALFVGLFLATGAEAQQPPPQPAANQTAEPVDYARWETEAVRVENLIEAGTASTSFFENLRRALVDWRARFLAERDAGASRVASVQAQIDALGPPPAEGATEAEAIAQRRTELNEQLARLQEPQLAAAAALTRAEGLIAEIDALLRERQQRQLLQLDPSPANPVNWPSAVAALRDIAMSQVAQFQQRLRDPVIRRELRDNAPGILVLVLGGLLAIFRGRRWTTRLTERLQARARTRGRVAVAFLVSLLQITVPFVGVLLLLTAAVATGLANPQAMRLLEALAALAASVYVSLWLAGRLFGDEGDVAFATLREKPGLTTAARRVVVSIGVAVGLATVAEAVSNFDTVPPAAHGVIKTPAYLLLGYLFWRAARLLRADIPVAGSTEDGGPGFANRTLSITATALVLLALIGPALALVGYVNMTEAVMVPAAQSLLVIGILVAIQPVVRDLYAVAFRATPEEAAQALVPVLVSFLLVFAALPVFALLWGMRWDQLVDIYSRFWEGFTLGEARITPGGVFAIILVFAIGLIITRLLQGALRTTVLPRTKLDTGARTAVISGVGYVGIGLAAVIAITAGGIDLTALGVVVGALSVGIGFGLQNVVNNFVSGIILLIERPISEGDWIEVNGTMGIVKDISVRSTRVETFDKTDVIVPNADFISGTVTNWTRSNTIGRAVVTVGVAYGTDTRRVQQILLEIAREHPVVAAYPEPGVDFLGFGADSLDFRIRAILRDVNQLLSVQTEMHHRIAERFTEEGIEIPFAQRDVWLRNPETLVQPRPAPETANNTDAAPVAEAPAPSRGDTPA
jgi:small-conductance mechanosensitive channel